ncbi:MAG: hypothetical protein ACRD88_04080, partial [Terriglobia bacterium]
AQAVGPRTAMQCSPGGATEILIRKSVGIAFFRPYRGSLDSETLIPRADALGHNLSRFRRCVVGEKSGLELSLHVRK